MNDCEENNKSAYDTCVAFNPNAAGLLRYDEKNALCILGGEQGLELKDQSNQVCEVKYNVKIEMEVNDSSTLYLYFSDNGGESFYNSDEPRVATKDEAKRRRLQSECSTCAQSTCKGIGEFCGSDSWWGIVGFGCYGNAVSVPSYKCEHSGSLMGIWTLWLGSFAYKSEDCCSGCLYWECGWASLGACDYYCGRLA